MIPNPQPTVEKPLTYGRLLVLEQRRRNSVLYWRCRCTCGTEKEITKQAILSGRSKSCGCGEREARFTSPKTHGMSRTRTYNIWMHIWKRCTSKKCPSFRWYGGRGINVCARWKRFETFLADMGEAPAGMSIDRIDVDGNYEPSNCRWASRPEQARNTRRTIFVTHRGERLCLKDWADRIGVKPSAMYAAKVRGNDLSAYIAAREKA